MNTEQSKYFISAIKKVNTIILGLIAGAFLNRALGPSGKGEYSTCLNVVNILNVVLNLGISTIYPNYIRKRKAWTESTFVFLSILQFGFYISLAVVIGIFAEQSLLLYIWLSISCSVLAIQLNNITLVEQYVGNAIANVCSLFLNVILAVCLFVLEIGSVEFALLCFCAKEFSLACISLFFLRKEISFREVKVAEIGGIIRNGFLPMLATLFISLNYRIDILFLNYFQIDFYRIGLYSAGLGIAEYAWIIPDVFKDVLINKTTKKDSLESVSFSVRISSSILILAYFVLFFFGKFVIWLLYGVEFFDAISITRIVFLGVYGMIYCKLLGTLYLAQGRWRFYFFTLLGAVLINVFANSIFIPLWGIYGAAFTTIFSYSFAGLVFLLDYRKKYRLRIFDLVLINSKDIKAIMDTVQAIKSKIWKRKERVHDRFS